MATAVVNVSKCIQDVQEIGGSNDSSVMRSRVFFSLSLNGKTFNDLYVEISQPYGTNYATELIEVSRPVGYDGPFSHTAFCNEIERYYRSLVGQGASMISISGGSNIRMSNNTFVAPYTFQIEVDSNAGSAW
jgi:hypothetical protein